MPTMSTRPRQIIPGATYLITRRCTQQQFLLQPDEYVNSTLSYALALVAKRHGIQLHAWCFLSNHYHLVASDPNGRIPDFMRDFHSLVARALNAYTGRWENFWASGEPSLVRLLEEADVLDKVLYTLCNPVSSWLVPESRHWPGLQSHPENMAQRVTVERPEKFFGGPEEGEEPLELFVTPPEGWSLETFQSHSREAVQQREAELQAERRTSGRGFLGLAAIRKQRREDRPRSPAPRRDLSPRIACKDEVKREAALEELDSYVDEYRAALIEFARGVRDVLFPLGTFLMRARYQVRVASAP